MQSRRVLRTAALFFACCTLQLNGCFRLVAPTVSFVVPSEVFGIIINGITLDDNDDQFTPDTQPDVTPVIVAGT